jgi:hypothetical protein
MNHEEDSGSRMVGSEGGSHCLGEVSTTMGTDKAGWRGTMKEWKARHRRSTWLGRPEGKPENFYWRRRIERHAYAMAMQKHSKNHSSLAELGPIALLDMGCDGALQ